MAAVTHQSENGIMESIDNDDNDNDNDTTSSIKEDIGRIDNDNDDNDTTAASVREDVGRMDDIGEVDTSDNMNDNVDDSATSVREDIGMDDRGGVDTSVKVGVMKDEEVRAMDISVQEIQIEEKGVHTEEEVTMVQRRTMRKLDVQVFAFASNGFIDALNISEAEYGIVVTTNYIAQTAFLYPSAIFAKQIGLRVYLTTVMTLQGCILALTPLVNSFASLLAVRGVLGIIQSALMPSMTAYMADFYGKEGFGTAWARSFNIGAPLGSLVGAPITALLMKSFKENDVMADWKWPFLLEALAVFAVAVPTFVFLPTHPSKCTFLNADEQSWFTQKSNASQNEKVTVSSNLAQASNERNLFLTLLTDYRIIILAFTRLFRTIGVVGLMFFTPLILEDAGMKPSKAALSIMLMILASIIFGQYWATRSDYRRERVWHTLVGLLLLFVGLTAATIALNFKIALWVLVVCLVVSRMGVQGSIIPFQAFQADILPRNAANSGMAIIAFFGGAAGIVSPIIIGFLRSTFGGFVPSLLFIASSAGLACATFFPLAYMNRRRQLHVDDSNIEITIQK